MRAGPRRRPAREARAGRSRLPVRRERHRRPRGAAQRSARSTGSTVELIDDVRRDDGGADASRLVDLDPRAARRRAGCARRASCSGGRRRSARRVVHGEQRGRELGYPTANLDPAIEGMLPADGVYAAWATVDGDAVRRGRVDRQQPDVRRHPAAPGRGAPARPEARPLRHDDRAGFVDHVRRDAEVRLGRRAGRADAGRRGAHPRDPRRSSSPAPPRARTGTAPSPRPCPASSGPRAELPVGVRRAQRAVPARPRGSPAERAGCGRGRRRPR